MGSHPGLRNRPPQDDDGNPGAGGTSLTIKIHLLHIYAKLGVRDRAASVGEAFRCGLLG
jgi:hypothetical protein